jgi:hypothetical protein
MTKRYRQTILWPRDKDRQYYDQEIDRQYYDQEIKTDNTIRDKDRQ